MIDIFAGPNAVYMQSEAGWLKAARAQGNAWSVNGSTVFLTATDFQIGVALESTCPVKRIHLRWQDQFESPRILGDQWERGYGDWGWQGLVPERVMPWYVMVVELAGITGYGEKTGSKAMCFWRIDSSGLSLVLDVRSGSEALRLGHRILDVATMVAVHAGTDRSPFAATQQLCERMCENPKMPTVPIYGGNNWYYAYGKSSYAGEEMGRSGPTSATMAWHLDPIDGTTNCVHRIPASAFSLGLVDAHNDPVLGLVMNLFTGDVFYGRDHSVWWNHQLVVPSLAKAVNGEVVLTELEGFRAWPELSRLQTWLEDHYGTLRILGSSALALAETAVGHGAATALSRFNSWDVAGGLALCRAAGLSWADRRGLRTGLPEDGLMVGPRTIVEALWNATWSDA